MSPKSYQAGRSSSETGDLQVCSRCIGSKRFSQWIEENGETGSCDFKSSHGHSQTVISIEDLAEEVDSYFRENFQLGEEYPYWEGDSDSPSYKQHGEPYEDILAQELECEPEIVDAVSKSLPDASPHDIAQGDMAFYDDTANYESMVAVGKRRQEEWEEHWYENRFKYQWQDFCRIVQYERRFFNIKQLLDQLFGDQSEYEQGKIAPMYPLKAGTKIYRARLLDSEFTPETLRGDPARRLGAPPREKARAGRMNVEFIPAFYGAFCKETAVAEIRPSIGDEVAVGEFTLTREIKAFDFTAFSLSQGDRWAEVVYHTRYDFIRQMQNEISKPISPFAMQREYIATQIVAEYLREYFNCDAVIYKSSMHRDNKMDNRNIVLLNKGIEFVGTEKGCVLAYSRYDTMDINDVVYKISSSPF